MRYLFPDHWSFLLGEVALYAFLVLIATGIYLTLFFDPSTAKTVYHGAYTPLRRAADERRLQVGGRHLAHLQGRAADPPDPSLGGGRVRRGDPHAPDARVLHRCFPCFLCGFLGFFILAGFLAFFVLGDLLVLTDFLVLTVGALCTAVAGVGAGIPVTVIDRLKVA